MSRIGKSNDKIDLWLPGAEGRGKLEVITNRDRFLLRMITIFWN